MSDANTPLFASIAVEDPNNLNATEGANNEIQNEYPQNEVNERSPYNNVEDESDQDTNEYEQPNGYNSNNNVASSDYYSNVRTSSGNDLYNIEYIENITPLTWSNYQSNTTKHSDKYWGDVNTFNPEIYGDKVNSERKFRCIFSLIYVFVNIVVVIVAGSIAINKVGAVLNVQEAIGFSFLNSIIAILFNFLGMLFLPEFYLKYGMFVGTGICFITSIIGMCYKKFVPIAYDGLSIIYSLVLYLFTRYNINYSKELLRLSIRTQFLNYFWNFVFLAINILIVSAIFIFFIYVNISVMLLEWNKFMIVYNIYVYWLVTNTLGNIVYMISASVGSAYYMTSGTSYQVKFPILKNLLRSAIFNFGTASKVAIFFPPIEWIRSFSRVDPKRVREAVPSLFGEGFKNFIEKLLNFLLKYARKFGLSFDNSAVNPYPSRQGLIYTGVFGVSYKEGCERYAELSLNNYVHLLHETQTIGTNLMFHCINAAMISGFSTRVYSYGILNSKYTTSSAASFLIGGYGFFFTYGILHLFRSMIRGHYESLLFGYSEFPNRLRSIDENCANTFEVEFENELKHRCNDK